MLLVVLALFVQQASPPSTLPPDDEIIVVGRRMRDMRFVIRPARRGGNPVCRVRRSSGDAALDAMICAVGVECVGGAASARQIEDCVRPRLEAIPALYLGAKRPVSVGPVAR